MRRILPIMVVFACLLAGCGGHDSTPSRAAGHPCSPGDYFMNCVQQTPPKNLTAPAPVAHGIDFAWGCPSPSGHNFAGSYLSFDRSKNWTRSCVDQWHRAGTGTIVVWETSATRALAGRSAGSADARAALSQALALGLQGGRPIFFAVDFDETAAQSVAVASYFRGVHDVLDNAGPVSFPTPVPVGAYGGYWTIKRLFDAGLIKYGWQAYAWSGGLWDTRAKLEQYLNGSTVDYDRAIASDYGQWPYGSAPPLPKCFTHRITKADCDKARAQVKAAGRGAQSSLGAYQARGCDVLRARERWFADAIKRQPRSPRLAYRQGALAATKRAESRQQCQLFAGRVDYFLALENRIRAAN